jgi:hypothetical protein
MIWIVATDGVVRERLPDETLLVFLSDTHIGGSSGSDIFESAAELTMLLVHLHHHEGPVELVLAGDILDLLRLGDPGRGEDLVAATLARPESRAGSGSSLPPRIWPSPGWSRCSARDRPTWCWPAAAMATSTSPGRTQGSPCSFARWRRSAG